MLQISRPSLSRTAAALVTAALATAACGGEDRLTRDEYAAEVQPVVQRISADFGGVFAAIGRAEESDRVPAAALTRLARAARRERAAAERLAGLEPPEQLAGPAARFAAGARRHADELERIARRDRVSVAQLADAIERGAVVAPMRELVSRGVVEPPAHQG